MKSAVILFDETGTPTLKGGREGRFFSGVSVGYAKDDESRVFEVCSTVFSLESPSPVKRCDFTTEMATKAGAVFAEVDLPARVVYIDLENDELVKLLPEYEKFGNRVRLEHQHKGRRKHSHILHSEILNHGVLKMLFDLSYAFEKFDEYEIYYDNWTYPSTDKRIVGDFTRESMQQRANEILSESGMGRSISVSSLEPLCTDTPRKRFIDAVTTLLTFDRRLAPSHANLVKLFPEFKAYDAISFEDITAESCAIFTAVMNEIEKMNGPTA